jgi:hypothetical protein
VFLSGPGRVEARFPQVLNSLGTSFKASAGLSSQLLRLQDLRGKVVLVRRLLDLHAHQLSQSPAYIKEWIERYRDRGLARNGSAHAGAQAGFERALAVFAAPAMLSRPYCPADFRPSEMLAGGVRYPDSYKVFLQKCTT